MTKNQQDSIASWGFVTLMALLMSFVALTIDAMMPALNQIGQDLQVSNPNDTQFVISSVFLGMGMGLVFFGPLSDSYGRKPAIFLGMSIFIVGCLISIFSTTFEVMIVGRLFQGLGGASCRVVTLAMIRDRFSGSQMAKVMSLIMIIFILVPALAPSIGQVILIFAQWRAIFVFMLALSALCLFWLAVGQKETLEKNKRLPFSVKTIVNGASETIKNRLARGYTVISSLVFGSFIGYLSSAQQVLQEQYKLGKMFSVAFGCLALMIGLAAFVNTKWVDKVGMEEMCKKALKALVVLSGLGLSVAYLFGGRPPLALLLIYLGSSFFCFGILFGNFNTLAVQTLGHIAGVANSVIGSFQTLISVILGGFIGYCYDGTVLPMLVGFFVLEVLSLFILLDLTKVETSS